MSKETIAEAAERELEYFHESARGFDFDLGFKTGMVKGAIWQEKKMYSEEDLRKAFNDGQNNLDHNPIEGWYAKLTESEWFEQFKKQKA